MAKSPRERPLGRDVRRAWLPHQPPAARGGQGVGGGTRRELFLAVQLVYKYGSCLYSKSRCTWLSWTKSYTRGVLNSLFWGR